MSAGIRGFYNDSASALTNQQEGEVRISPNRAMHVNLRRQDGTEVGNVANPLYIQGSLSVGGTTDEAAWTAGSSTFTGTGGAFNDSAAALTSGQQGTFRATTNRALHVNIRDHLGNEATLTGNSLNVNVTNAASGGTALADKAAFTVGTTNFTPAGGLARTDQPDLVADATGVAFAATLRRGLHVNLRTQTGTELLGQQLMAASIPVTLASNQSALSVTATNLFALDSTVAKDASITQSQGTVAAGVAATKSTLIGGVFNTALPSPTNGQQVALQLDSSGRVIVAQATASALNVTVGNATLAVTQSGTWTVQPGATANSIANSWRVQVTDLTNTLPTMDVAARKGFVAITDGTNTATVKAASTSAAATDLSLVVQINPQQTPPFSLSQVNGVAALAGNGVTGTGSLRVTIASDNTAFAVKATGDVADAASDSGNPVKIGAVTYNTSRTSTTNGQRVNLTANTQGALIVYPVKPREFIRTQTTTITASVTETTIITAGAAGVFNDIVSLAITNSSATACTVTLKDSTAGTTRGVYALAANGGIVLNFPVPLAQQAAAANNWTLTCGTSVSSIIASAVYVIAT